MKNRIQFDTPTGKVFLHPLFIIAIFAVVVIGVAAGVTALLCFLF